MADEAQKMAEKYRALAEIVSTQDRQRYVGMADWWLKRATEAKAAEETETSALSNSDTQAQSPTVADAQNSNSADAPGPVAEGTTEATQQPASDLASGD